MLPFLTLPFLGLPCLGLPYLGLVLVLPCRFGPFVLAWYMRWQVACFVKLSPSLTLPFIMPTLLTMLAFHPACSGVPPPEV